MSKLQGKTVLIIDDDIEFRVLLKKTLSAVGAFCEETSTAEEALEMMFKEVVPHIIILDVKLEKESGIYFLNEVSHHALMKTIPIIVYSAYEDERIKKSVFKLGVKEYLVKPLNGNIFLKSLNRVMGPSKELSYDFMYNNAPQLKVSVAANIQKINEVACVIRSPVKTERDFYFDIEMEGLQKVDIDIKKVVNFGKPLVVEPGVYDAHFTLLGVSENEAQVLRRIMSRYNYGPKK